MALGNDEEAGEPALAELLSGFSCPKNPDVERFLKKSAIEFTKKNQSVTSVLQRQYRYPVNAWQWEMPGGFVDEGETPEEAAGRELKEETGFETAALKSLGAFYPSFGSTNEKIHLFFAECGRRGESAKEPGEVLYQEEVSKENFREMIADGRFMHGAGLAAWARYVSQF